MGEMGNGKGEAGNGKRGGRTHRAGRRGELAAGGAGGRRGARRDGALGRRDRGRGRRRVSAREAPGQHRFRSVVAQADDARVRDAGAGRAAPAPLARADLYAGVPMEELSPLEPLLRPTPDRLAAPLFRAPMLALPGEGLGERHRDRGARDPQEARSAEPRLRTADWAAARAPRGRHAPQLLALGRGGASLWAGRAGHRAPGRARHGTVTYETTLDDDRGATGRLWPVRPGAGEGDR